MICYTRFDHFVAKAIVANSGHLLRPVVANHRSLQLPLPFIVCVALPFLPLPASRNIRSIVRRTSWHVSKCGKKGRSQRILLRTCREIVYSAVLRWKKNWKE